MSRKVSRRFLASPTAILDWELWSCFWGAREGNFTWSPFGVMSLVARHVGFQIGWRIPFFDWESVRSHLRLCLEPCVQVGWCADVECRLRFLARCCCGDTRHETPHRLTGSFVVSPLAGSPVEASAKRPRHATRGPNLWQVYQRA